jgi:hypothetical protein
MRQRTASAVLPPVDRRASPPLPHRIGLIVKVDEEKRPKTSPLAGIALRGHALGAMRRVLPEDSD